MGQKSYPFAYKLLFVFCGHVSVGFSSFLHTGTVCMESQRGDERSQNNHDTFNFNFTNVHEQCLKHGRKCFCQDISWLHW